MCFKLVEHIFFYEMFRFFLNRHFLRLKTGWLFFSSGKLKWGRILYFCINKLMNFLFFFAIALIRKYKNNPDVSITFINEKKKSLFLKRFFTLLMLIFCLLISNQETQQCLRWVPNNCWSSWLIQWIDWYCDKKS